MSLESERTLLATMMLRPSECWGVEIEPRHFSADNHAELAEAIASELAASNPVDPVSLADSLSSRKRKDLVALALALGNEPTTAVPQMFARRIVAAWRMREARVIANTLARSESSTAVDEAIASLMGLSASEQRHEFGAKQAAQAALAELDRVHQANGALPGVTTGLLDLDDKLGGFHAGDLVVIGARAAMGKTAMLIGMSRAAAASGMPVGLISGEQPVEQVAARMVSSAAKLNAKLFRTARFDDGEWNRVFQGFADVSNLPIQFLDRSSPTLAEVVRVARRWQHVHGIKALYVDYLQRIGGEGERKHEQVGYVARGLKNLARDLGIPVIVLAQVSRAVESREGKVPRMGDLSDSSEIEKEADQVLLIHRPGYYDENADPGKARVIVDKNRHGPTGYVDLSWQGETMTFANLARADSW